MPVVPRGAAFCPVSPQAARPSGWSWRGARLAVQLLLRPRRLPHAADAPVVAVPRPQGLCRRDGGADRDHAGGRDCGADATAVAAGEGQPADGRALAPVVARHIHGEFVLADRAGCVDAAGRPGSASGLAARTFCWQRKRAAHRAAAFHRSDHGRRQAGSTTVFSDPQRMLIASNRMCALPSVLLDPEGRRRDTAGTRSATA